MTECVWFQVLGRARTGTGKTVAFLVPALQNSAAKSNSSQHERHESRGIDVLAISPTRELASQISEQGEQLLSFSPKRSVQVMFGGTKKPRDINQLERNCPSLLVATPGRLLDHLQTTRLRNGSFKDLVSNVQVLILDEADQLLEMGFRNDIMEILSYLPAQKQTLLFSATIPPGLTGVMEKTMRTGSVTVDCIHDDDGATHSVDQVPQSHVLLPDNGRQVSGKFTSNLLGACD